MPDIRDRMMKRFETMSEPKRCLAGFLVFSAILSAIIVVLVMVSAPLIGILFFLCLIWLGMIILISNVEFGPCENCHRFFTYERKGETVARISSDTEIRTYTYLCNACGHVRERTDTHDPGYVGQV